MATGLNFLSRLNWFKAQDEKTIILKDIRKIAGKCKLEVSNDGSLNLLTPERKLIATLRLVKFPYCSSICIMCNFSVDKDYRAKGIGKLFWKYGELYARGQNYCVAMCIVNVDNKPQNKIVSDWEIVNTIYNDNTGNTLNTYQKCLS